MMKKTITAVLAVCFALNAYAGEKITLDMAIEQDAAARAYNNSVDMGALKGGMSQAALETTGGGTGWKAHWSGSTTGSVAIPGNAKEIFVVTSNGTHSFPKNSGAFTLETVSRSNQSLTATATSRFTGSSVIGGSQTKTAYKDCSSNGNRQCKYTASASVYINKVMYK
ncbi:hypothetical protein RJD38_21650 (plasmid) [Vibrio scophthalmi]|uniref:hypothetical protein n=1 Tax=Vibrio scophthalmi TaxID=45658 RepID=UPI00080968DA|nr:hypothetical protein [Vibrio scophthalmi]ANS88118.1 hypothetical protein VSVS12_04419 [Vibrio scophthalmi]